MSYSFSVKAATKAEAVALLPAKFAEVLASQPVHTELEDSQKAAEAMAARVREASDTEDFYISVNGSVWAAPEGLNSASVNVSVGLTAKTPPSA